MHFLMEARRDRVFFRVVHSVSDIDNLRSDDTSMLYHKSCSREANVSFRNSSHKAKNIYARADNNNPPGVAHNRNRY
jgi:hypothetical protein